MISVVIPLYNKGRSIAQALESVLTQSVAPSEVIVVDDGSSDDSLEVVKRVSGDRVKLITKSNGGVSSARNLGMKAAHSEFIAFLDADDLWAPHHIATILEMKATYPQADILATSIVASKGGGESLSFPHGRGSFHLVGNYFLRASSPQRLLSSSSIVVRRSRAIEAGLYDESLSYGEDVDFWYRMVKSGASVAFSDDVTAIYRLSGENRSDQRYFPIEKRFHSFDFRRAAPAERMYLGKLVLLILADYARVRDWGTCLRIVRRYAWWLHWAALYAIRLAFKRATG